jgi:deoxyribonuclease (pyrimidine dimer)
MTRINVVAPQELTDQHLMAEYRELPMVMGSLRRSLKSKNGLPESGKEYTLNAGHVKFFYNKGKFLYHRYQILIDELVDRGYKLDPERKADFQVFIENQLYHDWEPNEKAKEINRQRIAERIAQKPSWYRFRGVKVA